MVQRCRFDRKIQLVTDQLLQVGSRGPHFLVCADVFIELSDRCDQRIRISVTERGSGPLDQLKLCRQYLPSTLKVRQTHLGETVHVG